MRVSLIPFIPPFLEERIVKSYLPSPLGGEGQGEGKIDCFLSVFAMPFRPFTPTLSLPPQGGGFPLSFRMFQIGFS